MVFTEASLLEKWKNILSRIQARLDREIHPEHSIDLLHLPPESQRRVTAALQALSTLSTLRRSLNKLTVPGLNTQKRLLKVLVLQVSRVDPILGNAFAKEVEQTEEEIAQFHSGTLAALQQVRADIEAQRAQEKKAKEQELQHRIDQKRLEVQLYNAASASQDRLNMIQELLSQLQQIKAEGRWHMRDRLEIMKREMDRLVKRRSDIEVAVNTAVRNLRSVEQAITQERDKAADALIRRSEEEAARTLATTNNISLRTALQQVKGNVLQKDDALRRVRAGPLAKRRQYVVSLRGLEQELQRARFEEQEARSLYERLRRDVNQRVRAARHALGILATFRRALNAAAPNIPLLSDKDKVQLHLLIAQVGMSPSLKQEFSQHVAKWEIQLQQRQSRHTSEYTSLLYQLKPALRHEFSQIDRRYDQQIAKEVTAKEKMVYTHIQRNREETYNALLQELQSIVDEGVAAERESHASVGESFKWKPLNVKNKRRRSLPSRISHMVKNVGNTPVRTLIPLHGGAWLTPKVFHMMQQDKEFAPRPRRKRGRPKKEK